MFKPNIIDGVIQPRFDEIKTHLNHQLSFSPYSNQGHILVDDKHYDFEVSEDGHIFSPAKLEGYDFYAGKSYLGHYNNLKFSPGDNDDINTEPIELDPYDDFDFELLSDAEKLAHIAMLTRQRQSTNVKVKDINTINMLAASKLKETETLFEYKKNKSGFNQRKAIGKMTKNHHDFLREVYRKFIGTTDTYTDFRGTRRRLSSADNASIAYFIGHGSISLEAKLAFIDAIILLRHVMNEFGGNDDSHKAQIVRLKRLSYKLSTNGVLTERETMTELNSSVSNVNYPASDTVRGGSGGGYARGYPRNRLLGTNIISRLGPRR